MKFIQCPSNKECQMIHLKKKFQRRFKFLVTHKGLHSIYTQYPIHCDIEQNIKIQFYTI